MQSQKLRLVWCWPSHVDWKRHSCKLMKMPLGEDLRQQSMGSAVGLSCFLLVMNFGICLPWDAWAVSPHYSYSGPWPVSLPDSVQLLDIKSVPRRDRVKGGHWCGHGMLRELPTLFPHCLFMREVRSAFSKFRGNAIVPTLSHRAKMGIWGVRFSESCS